MTPLAKHCEIVLNRSKHKKELSVKNRRWPYSEVQELMQLTREGKTAEEIHEVIPNHSVRSISRKMKEYKRFCELPRTR